MRKFVNGLFSGFFLLVCSSLFAVTDPLALTITEGFYGVFNSNDEFQLKEGKANLLRYKVTFADPTLPKGKGFIDENASYIAVESKLITNAKTIQLIKTTFRKLPPFTTIGNLNAYAGRFPGKELEQIVFVDQNDQYALKNGNVNTISNSTFQLSDMFIHNDFAKFLYEKVKKKFWFRQGRKEAPKVMFVVGEPNCPICHQLYQETLPFVQSGELQIRWLLVSFIRGDSRGKVFAIYDGEVPKGSGFPHTPEGAWNYNEENFIVNDYGEFGGIPPSIHPSKKTITRANSDLNFFIEDTPEGVPFIIFKNAQGQPDFFEGVPPDIQAFINNLFIRSSS